MTSQTQRSRPLVRAQRAWRRSALRDFMARRRIRLQGLPSGSHNLLVVAGVAGLVLSGLLLYNAQVSGKSPSIGLPNQLIRHRWPSSVVLGVLGGLLITQLLVVRLALTTRGRRSVPYALTAGLSGAAVLLVTWRQIDLGTNVYAEGPEVSGLSRALLAICLTATAVGMIAMIRGGRTLSHLVVCSPVVLAAAWVVARVSGIELSGPADNRVPDAAALASVIARGVVVSGFAIAGVTLAITLWQTIEAVRATRDAAGGAGALFARMVRAQRSSGRVDPWLVLAVLLGVKLAWVTAGVGGALPGILGGDLDVWHEIQDDGWVSWLLALAIGIGVMAWLMRGCPGPRDGPDVVRPVVAVVAGLALPEIAFQAFAMIYGSSGKQWFFDAANWVESVQPWAPVVVVVLAGFATARRWLAGRRGAGTLFLAVFFAWGVVRLPVLVMDLVEYPWYPWGLSMPSESTYGQHAGWVGGATIDIALTAVLLVICLLALRDVRMRFVPVLVVALSTTLVVYPGMLTDVVVTATVGSALAFLLPFGYLYLFDAEALNDPDEGREQRLLGVAALSTLALTVGLLRSYFGYAIARQDVDLAAALLVVPVLVTTVVGMLAPRPGSVANARRKSDGGGEGVPVDHEPVHSE